MQFIFSMVNSPFKNNYRIGLLFVVLATIAWSTAGLFTRIIPLDNWTILVWRGFFGAIGIAIVAAVIDGKQAITGIRQLGVYGWVFIVISAVGMVMFISALKFTTVAHVSIIYATVPLVTAGVAWLVLREVPNRQALGTSVAALAGVVIMVSVNSEGHWLGDLLALGMTVCLAGMMIITRLKPSIPILPAAGISALLSAGLALPFSHPLAVEADQWAFLMLFGVVNSALGLTLFIIGSKYLPAIDTALITALDAPLAPVWVWLFFNETIGLSTLIGGMIVFIAVARYLHTSNMSESPNRESHS